MGKNKARHILHGVLDCLPIILIPIFMIYSQNHEINDNSITINESYWEVQNKYETNDIVNEQDIELNKIYHINHLEYQTTQGQEFVQLRILHTQELSIYGDGYIDESITYNYDANVNNFLALDLDTDSNTLTVFYTNDNAYTCVIYENLVSFELNNVDFVIYSNLQDYLTVFPYEYNQITRSDFQVLEYIYHENTPVVYNDTDIMSQSFYCLYNAVDKYFNMGNVFGMNNLYTWFETNIFGGTASPSIYIVWNIVLYEFIMDLLFLLYGLFMFFIDLCKRLMEKPLNSIK